MDIKSWLTKPKFFWHYHFCEATIWETSRLGIPIVVVEWFALSFNFHTEWSAMFTFVDYIPDCDYPKCALWQYAVLVVKGQLLPYFTLPITISLALKVSAGWWGAHWAWLVSIESHKAICFCYILCLLWKGRGTGLHKYLCGSIQTRLDIFTLDI